jgi:isoleucyl-tRNA synthetase
VFRPLPPDPDFVSLEADELARWRAARVFERSVAQRHGAQRWVFYEGPPTANNRPGLHHVWARVYKDLFCRYRTMRGYLVERRAGWDTHGLPVEVEVEKRLGVTGKRQIEEEVGIAEFVRLCRESVVGYVADWRVLTERIGYWVDLDAAYWTFDRAYVESVWWYLKQLFDKTLLYEDLKVVPYCPRCGTALSSHELGQPEVYSEEEDESAYVRFELVGHDRGRVGGAVALLVWTTTPWTLLSNTGVAVHPDLDYVVIDGHVVAEALADDVLGEGATARASARVKGRDLEGLRYRRPFDAVAVPAVDAERGWRVVLDDFVTTEEGTGLVHLAPAFGEVDRVVGRREGLPTLNPVGPDGRFTEEAGAAFAGRAVREANHLVDDRLEAAGLLVRRHLHRHPYPHCWRCGTALIYWGKPSWYIATSAKKADLVAANRTVEWHPGYIKEGRFGEWLDNNVDWALSRDRYWGTPLPIWRCEAGHVTCVGSLSELSELAGRDLSELDPHRPGIDEVELACPQCAAAGGDSPASVRTARRVLPVIDAWFDSGSMPAAQVGYPHKEGSGDSFLYPADFIAEAIDQTRGWFYSLLAVNTLAFGRAPYRHVMCLGHLVDAEGRKMSKSIGNVVDPWELVESRGADALRWWMYSQGSPWTATRVSLAAIDTALRDMLFTLWNTASFFTTYASLNGFTPRDPAIPAAGARNVLDRWALSRVSATVTDVTVALDAYEPLEAAGALSRLVDDLSNWYVRRSRRRFWRTDPGASAADSLGAQATLHTVLLEISRMLAPFCPFVADRLWRELGGPRTGAAGGQAADGHDVDDGASVHLDDWPVADPDVVDRELEAQMSLARQLSSLGRAARSDAGVKVRQPLSRALVFLAPGSPGILADLVADELNVDEVVEADELGDVLTLELVPNFRLLGPRLGDAVKEVRAALGKIDAARAADALEAGGTVEVVLTSGPVSLGPDEVEVRVRGQAGYSVSREGGAVVALDLAIDDELRRRGLVREVVRRVQDLRRARGLEVSDRIRLWLRGVDPSLFDAIGPEVLAIEVLGAAGPGEESPLDIEGLEGGAAWLERM